MGTRDLRSLCQRVEPLAKDQPTLAAMLILEQRGWRLRRRDDRVATRTHDDWDGGSARVVSESYTAESHGSG
jgi:hypothetical protein